MKDKKKSPGKKRGRIPGNAQFTARLPPVAVNEQTRALVEKLLADRPGLSMSVFLRDAVVTALAANGYKHKGETPAPQP